MADADKGPAKGKTRLIAVDMIRVSEVDGVGQFANPGEWFDVDDEVAESLVANGAATPYDVEPPAAADVVDPKENSKENSGDGKNDDKGGGKGPNTKS